MAYTDFTLDSLQEYFGVEHKLKNLFNKTSKLTLSAHLQEQLEDARNLPAKSEKAKSEFIVAPILIELRKRNNNFITVYSGDTLTADKQKGLTGECDFVITKDTDSLTISVPILTLVEAKKHDITIGIPQCAAQMLGAKIFNEQKGKPLDVIYGCVTTGTEWRFMRLENNIIEIDKDIYVLSDVEKLIGIFQFIIDYYKKVLVE